MLRDSTRSINQCGVAMPLTVLEAAVLAGGRHARGPHEAWMAADPFKGGFRVLITGPQGFKRTVA